MKQMPVFVCDGFLDSGKTTFILDTIANDGFKEQGHTLILACEDGEIEYDEAFLKDNNTSIEYINDISEMNSSNLDKIAKKHKPKRILIEFNGMWDFSNVVLPEYFAIGQFVTFVDYNTFSSYFVNMKQMMVNMFKLSDVVVFINCKNKEELQNYQTSLRLINNNASYFVFDEKGNGEIAFEEALPYDYEADVIDVKKEDFGRFYVDTFDHKERYNGKTISLTCMAFKSDRLPKGQFVCGRLAMTCCAQDIQLFGHLALSDLGVDIKDKDWIHIVFKMEYRYSKEYDEEEAVLHPISIEVVSCNDDPILNLS